MENCREEEDMKTLQKKLENLLRVICDPSLSDKDIERITKLIISYFMRSLPQIKEYAL